MKRKPAMIAVFATGPDYEFGLDNSLPWIGCKEDLENFKTVTMGKILLMGADTFRSLPRLLPDRIHVVLSTDSRITCKNGDTPHYRFTGNFLQCIETIETTIGRNIAVIGGPSIISQAVNIGKVKRIHVSTLTNFNFKLKSDVRFDYTSLLTDYTKIRYNEKTVDCVIQDKILLIEEVYEINKRI